MTGSDLTGHDSVHSRRATILAAAGDELQRARGRRVRNARLVTAGAFVALAAIAWTMLPRTSSTGDEHRTLAIDFATVGASPTALDFAVVDATSAPLLDTLTDDEAEEALAESGYCVRILRVENRPLLVDCTTGRTAIVR